MDVIDRSQYTVKVVNDGALHSSISRENKCDSGSVSPSQEMTNIITAFSLNAAQTHTFMLVVCTVTSADSWPLCMYLGDFGSTGKSQVIRALSKFFEQRQEAHCFCIMTLTESMGAHIGSSTYCSLFGFGEGEGRVLHTKLSKLQDLHQGTDMYLEKVSMVSTSELVVSRAVKW